MRSTRTLTVLAAALLLGACSSLTGTDDQDLGPLGKEYKNCTVADVHDGDTFTCQNGDRVRLIGVDAPELAQAPYGDSARVALQRLLPLGLVVRYEPGEDDEKDSQGRKLGYVYVDGMGEMVQEHLLDDGWVVAFPDNQNTSYREEFGSRELSAHENGVGMWGMGFSCRPNVFLRGGCS